MIPLPPELERIEKDLTDRKITGDEASSVIFATRRKLGPTWHWKSWKHARKKVLSKKCEICGAGTESILYVQHTFKDPRVQPYLDAAKKRLEAMESEVDWRPDLRKKMYEIRDTVIPGMRDCCPKCKGISI